MSHFAAMKSPLPVAAAGDAKSPLFCPKPRRPVAPLRCHQSGDAGAGLDLLELLSKGEESGSGLLAASPQPPLFCGSPPRRASNPVVHDSLFGTDVPPLPVAVPVAARAYPTPRPSAAPSMSPRGGAGTCARARFAFQPAAVRVEGFDCLDGGRRGRAGHGITAMA